MGSSLCNLLILAVLDMSRCSQGRMLSRLSAAHALSAALSIVLTAIVVISLLLAGRLARFDFGGISISIANLAILLAYVLVDGNYELSGEYTGAAALDVAGHPVSIDLPALTRR